MSQRDLSAARPWLEGMRRMAGEPLLSRLRHVDQGPALDVREVGELLELVDDRDDSWWLGDGIVRKLSAEGCARVLAAFRAYAGSSIPALDVRREVRTLMGLRAAPALLAELRDGPSEEVLQELLRELEDLAREHADLAPVLAASEPMLRSLLDPSREEIDEGTRLAVARLLLRADCPSDEVRRLVAADLASLLEDLDLENDDLVVAAEEWLTLLGTLGESARFVAPHLDPILRCDVSLLRVAASRAALGLRETSLVPALRHALEREVLHDLAGPRERAIHCAALWRLTGEAREPRESWLDRMRAEAGDGSLALHCVAMALATSSLDEVELCGLVKLASDPIWTSSICGVFAKAGPRAASAVAMLDVPAADAADAHSYVAYHEARWRTGLASAEEMALALEARLEWSAWGPYLRADVRSERWAARIKKEIADSATHVIPPEIAGELCASPSVAAQFLPDLRHGYDATLRTLWRQLPEDVFWRSLGEDSRS